MEKWGEHGLWSLKMNGRKSKSRCLCIILFTKISLLPSQNVDQALMEKAKTKKLLDYGESLHNSFNWNNNVCEPSFPVSSSCSKFFLT